MMIILHGDTIEKLTFILSEFKAALAVTNPGRGSRQLHMGATLKLHQSCTHNINTD